jgi:hypothetical protein
MTLFRLSFNGSIYEPQANAFRARIVQILERPDCDSLTVMFSSEGGSTDQGQALYNFRTAANELMMAFYPSGRLSVL